MTKNTWKALAEKYDTKAKWADALLFLNTDDHEELVSALIELSPEDIVKKSGDIGSVHINVSSPVSPDSDVVVRELNRLDIAKIRLDEADEKLDEVKKAQDKAQKSLDIATAAAQEISEVQARLDNISLDNISSKVTIDAENIFKQIIESAKKASKEYGKYTR